ncbi:MAG: hypothetical protein Q8R88_00005, partial [Desulfoprunum sp.]|nr:hypothetical protein [Desulfoprunum sp.]
PKKSKLWSVIITNTKKKGYFLSEPVANRGRLLHFIGKNNIRRISPPTSGTSNNKQGHSPVLSL